MRRKYKLTGFARFTIFLLAITPLCYFGAIQYQNNPKVKAWVNEIQVDFREGYNSVKTDTEEDAIDKNEEKKKEIKEEIEILKERIESLESELAKKEV